MLRTVALFSSFIAVLACGDDDAGMDAGGGNGRTDSGADSGRSDAGIFAGAQPTELVQSFLARWDSDDAGLPPDVSTGDITLALRDGVGHLTYVTLFTCGEPFDAFTVREGHDVHVLLRSRGPTGCGGAFYRVRVALENADADTRAIVYEQNTSNGPIRRVASATVDGAASDCTGLVRCSSAEPCEYEGPNSETTRPIDTPEDIIGCASVDACGGGVCVERREACMMTCGTAECAILESYPVQVRCEP